MYEIMEHCLSEDDVLDEVGTFDELEDLLMVFEHHFCHRTDPDLPRYNWSIGTDKEWFDRLIGVLLIQSRYTPRVMQNTVAPTTDEASSVTDTGLSSKTFTGDASKMEKSCSARL